MSAFAGASASAFGNEMNNPLGLAYGSDSESSNDGEATRTSPPPGTARSNVPPQPIAVSSLIHRKPPSSSVSSAQTTPSATSRSSPEPRRNFIQSVSRSAAAPNAANPHPPSHLLPSDPECETPAAKLARLLRPPPGTVLPPEPPGDADPAIQAKISKWLDLKASGMVFNDRLEATHAFRNPSITSKMIEYLGLDERGSNFSKDVYNPAGFPPEAYYDKIAERQRAATAGVGGPYQPPLPAAAQLTSNPGVQSAIQKAQQAAIQFVSNVHGSAHRSGTSSGGSAGTSAQQPSGMAADSARSSGDNRKRSKWDRTSEFVAKRR
ncbi:SAP30-binding protein [Geranomyces variabilis]|uniref:SAP30-binding protein n=1 Tax=Geranomyces variabilis TaxID=109894 RepID=A0AAD5TGD8_9FUNG|nr:SAP30-binding protein [Geranomyces variabilis]